MQQISEWLNTYGILTTDPIIVFTNIEVLRTKGLNNLIRLNALKNRDAFEMFSENYPVRD